MVFFLDENFPKGAVELIERLGHKVHDIRGSNLEGLKDNKIFDLALKKKAIFLTTDKDFFHTIPRIYKKHFGIIVITLSKPDSNSIIEKLRWALNFIAKLNFEDSCLLLSDRRHYFSRI